MESLSTIYDSIGVRIRTSLEEKAMTQAELANQTRLAKSYISDVINNRKKPSLDFMIRVSSALNKPVDYFLTGETYFCSDYAVIAELNPIVEEMTPARLKAYIAIGQVMLREQEDEEERLNDRLLYMK